MTGVVLSIVLVVVVGALCVGVAAAGGGQGRRTARLEHRLAAVERKLDRLLDHLEVPTPEYPLAEVEACLSRGQKIQAIKVYRDATGVDLRTAKDAVERLAGER